MRVQIALQVVAASLMAGACFAAAPAAAAGGALAPHRAVYDLKLFKSHGKRSLEAGRGRIFFYFARRGRGRYTPPILPELEVDSAGSETLAGLKRWPFTISYFEQGTAKTGEQTPAYAIGFELYENGVSRALSFDYGDFVVSGTMSKLDLKDAPACK